MSYGHPCWFKMWVVSVPVSCDPLLGVVVAGETSESIDEKAKRGPGQRGRDDLVTGGTATSTPWNPEAFAIVPQAATLSLARSLTVVAY